MSSTVWRPESFRTWVEAVARHIGDPVARLRFLRVAAPAVPAVPTPSRSRRRRILLAFLALPVAIMALLFLVFAAARARFVKLPAPSKAERSVQHGDRPAGSGSVR